MSRGRVLFAVAALGASLGWVAIGGLRGSLEYYRTPTEVANEASSLAGQRIRLGGLVVTGSVHASSSDVRFEVTDGTTTIPVVDTAPVPAMFRAGAGVVAEGTYGADGLFRADDVLVKHDDSYRPPTASGGA